MCSTSTTPSRRWSRAGSGWRPAASFSYADRVPVGFCLVPRYFTPLFDIPYRAFFESAEEQFHWQLQFLKYRLEHIPEDIVCTGPALSVGPYFDNVLDSAAFGAEIIWPENETLHSPPDHPQRRGDGALPAAGARQRPLGAGARLVAADGRAGPRDQAHLQRRRGPRRRGAPRHQRPQPAHDRRGPGRRGLLRLAARVPGGVPRLPRQDHRRRSSRRSATSWSSTRGRAGGFGLAEDTAQILSPASSGSSACPTPNRLYDAFGPGPGGARPAHVRPEHPPAPDPARGAAHHQLRPVRLPGRARGSRARTSAAACSCGATSTRC